MYTKLLIGSDHRGFQLKSDLVAVFGKIEWIDCGTFAPDAADYPLIARTVINRLIAQEAQAAVLLCGTGAGMQIAANRNRGVYAAVAWNEEVASRIKQEDNCTVLVLPADFISLSEAKSIFLAWAVAEFQYGRYAKRVHQIDSDAP